MILQKKSCTTEEGLRTEESESLKTAFLDNMSYGGLTPYFLDIFKKLH